MALSPLRRMIQKLFRRRKKMSEQILSGIAIGNQRRSEEWLKNFYEENLRSQQFMKEELLEILDGLKTSTDDIDSYLDCGENSLFEISWVQFKNLLERPSIIQQWVRGLPVCDVIADAISMENTLNPLGQLSLLEPIRIQAIVKAVSAELKQILVRGVQRLSRSFEAQKRVEMSYKNPKFQLEPMIAGSADDYHRGLEERIGYPHLEFFKAMKTEHQIEDLELQPMFSKPQIRRTTPKEEWELVVLRRELEEADFLGVVREKFPHIGFGKDYGGRRMPDVQQLLTAPCNLEAKLVEEEIIAVVLYTGPMFQLYNKILRRFPETDFQNLERRGQLFTTTIHILVSAVQKLSSTTRIPDGTILYRGLGGTAELPSSFFRADKQGRRGFAEWAFMSTTSKREVALMYSGAKHARPRAMVLSMRAGSVDRGACIAAFSQYEHESEYLWLPLSFLQPDGLTALEVAESGVVSMVPVRVTVNFKGATVEQVLARKKITHMTAFKFMQGDLQVQLERLSWKSSGGQADKRYDVGEVNQLIVRILEECRQVMHTHNETAASEFAVAQHFARLNQDMVEFQRFAESKLRLWLEDGESFQLLLDRRLRESHRLLIALRRAKMLALQPGSEERRAAARAVCLLKGLIRENTEETNELGETPLIQGAADEASPDALLLLLEAGAERDAKTSIGGVTAAYRAAQVGSLTCLRVLIEAGAALEVPTWVAARNGFADCLQALIEARADVNVERRGGGQPIHAAAWNNNPSCIRALLAAAADVEATCMAGKTPLLVAAGWGYVASAQVLLEARADVHRAQQGSGATPLHQACRFGRDECLKLLCEAAGGNLDCADGEGVTPLRRAVEARKAACVRVLVLWGADPRRAAGADGRSAWEAARDLRDEECLLAMEVAGGVGRETGQSQQDGGV